MTSNWYWNKRLGEMAADFIGFQGTPNGFGNALKTQLEEQNVNYAEYSLAIAGLAQSSAAVSSQVVANPVWLTKGPTAAIPWVGVGVATTALYIDLTTKVPQELEQYDGKLSDGTLLSLGSNLLAAASGVVGVLGITGLTVASSGALAVALGSGAIVLGFMALAQPSGTTDIMNMGAALLARGKELLQFAQTNLGVVLDTTANGFEQLFNSLTGVAGSLLDFLIPSANATEVTKNTAALFTAATTARPRDPLTLDLDGDGIETVGINTATPLMFDIGATGVQQSVGWIKPDDGFLVRDLNGNGLIDSGAELFGDATTLASGSKAADGFAALADLDANHDGVVNASDAAFSSLRVWRDLDQDGVTDSGELATLASLGIAGLNVASTSHAQLLTDGNQLADLGTYVKANGDLGTLGQAADVNLAVDTFTSQFTDTLPVSDDVLSLPDMQGAGQVRSLHEAATLSPALATLLTQFQSADRAGQRSLLDQIAQAWADTSPMATTTTGAYAGHALTLTWAGVAVSAVQSWNDKLSVLERFNGRTFREVPDGTDPVTITINAGAEAFLQQSYDAFDAINKGYWRKSA